MAKQYKITYKIYPNTRLNQIDFHGVNTHPIYIHLTYRRRSAIFKSYYFDLFSKERYAKNVNKDKPKLKDIIDFEKSILEYLKKHSGTDSTIEQLQNKYYLYSLDLCTSAEELFNANLFLVLKEIGTGSLARAIAAGSYSQLLFEIMEDMALILRPEMYEELLSQMSSLNQFYLPLYKFVLTTQKPPYLYLSVLEWQTGSTQSDFFKYLQLSGDSNPNSIINNINNYIASFQNV